MQADPESVPKKSHVLYPLRLQLLLSHAARDTGNIMLQEQQQ